MIGNVFCFCSFKFVEVKFALEYRVRVILSISGLIAFVLPMLLGCAGNLVQMQYASSLKQSYELNINAPVLIKHVNGDLLAASYIPFVIEMLQQRGFNSIYTQGQIPDKAARNIIYIALVKTTRTFPTSSIQYVPSKILNRTACFNHEGMYYCRKETLPIITGYATWTNLLAEYHFIMDWYDNHMKKRILYVDGSVADGACVYEGIYKDLIAQTISRIDFNRPESYSYSAPLSYYGMSCLIQRTKILGVKR